MKSVKKKCPKCGKTMKDAKQDVEELLSRARKIIKDNEPAQAKKLAAIFDEAAVKANKAYKSGDEKVQRVYESAIDDLINLKGLTDEMFDKVIKKAKVDLDSVVDAAEGTYEAVHTYKGMK